MSANMVYNFEQSAGVDAQLVDDGSHLRVTRCACGLLCAKSCSIAKRRLCDVSH